MTDQDQIDPATVDNGLDADANDVLDWLMRRCTCGVAWGEVEGPCVCEPPVMIMNDRTTIADLDLTDALQDAYYQSMIRNFGETALDGITPADVQKIKQGLLDDALPLIKAAMEQTAAKCRPDRDALILTLARADGQNWVQLYGNRHAGEVMYGKQADAVLALLTSRRK